MKTGECFGEMALLYNVPRSATIKTLTNCYFWTLESQAFKKTLEEMISIEYDENRKFID
jgi:cGMP-dependent protein kinase